MPRRRTVAKQRVAPGPLDPFSQTYAAHGLVRLFSSWTGPCITVRRADNAEMDVGFSGMWPAVGAGSAFKSWLGSSTGYIKTFYDQSGNGHHAIQTGTTQQARIALGGVVDVGPNGHPVAVFDGVDDRYQITNSAAYSRNRPAVTMAGLIACPTGTGTRALIFAGVTAATARAMLWSRNTSPDESPRVSGRRPDAAANAFVTRVGPAADTFARLIGRFRPVDAQADMAVNGGVSTAGWHTAGNFSDADLGAGDVVLGGIAEGSSQFVGQFSVAVLSEAAIDIAALDAAMSQINP